MPCDKLTYSTGVPPWMNAYLFLSSESNQSLLINVCMEYLRQLGDFVGLDFNYLQFYLVGWQQYTSRYIHVYKRTAFGSKPVHCLSVRTPSSILRCFTTCSLIDLPSNWSNSALREEKINDGFLQGLQLHDVYVGITYTLKMYVNSN